VEEHITPDVAVGVWESTRLSGDDDFGRHEAWPLLRDVARWVISRGQFTARGFEIRLTSGPDEWQVSRICSPYWHLSGMSMNIRYARR
jgi:trehalose/maltose hydrolase-like predicted phosphorylase